MAALTSTALELFDESDLIRRASQVSLSAYHSNSNSSQITLHPEAESHGKLCDVCDALDVQALFTQKIRNLAGRISLATWEKIEESSIDCAFCRLVVASLKDASGDTHSGLFPSSEVYLENKKSWKRCVTNLNYDGPVSSVYSNKYHLRSAAKVQSKKEPRKRSYRVIVKFDGWETRGYFGEIQYLADGERQQNQKFFGRRVYCERADLELIRAWINICWHAHGKSCEEPGITSRLLGRIRVIDIQTRTVVDAPPGCRYAALTYVWGDRPQFQARKEHFQRDAFGRKCMPLPQRLPQTITDAFFIVHSIGLRYLWVDSLCIIQNSHEDRHDQILRMDAIYSSAVVTIAAASGAHSDTGISGVSLARAFHQVSEIIQGFRLAIPLPSYADLDRDDNLIWNTRGWTFQEKVLSRRLLMFTNHQVYFRCSNMVWCEDVVMETRRFSKSIWRQPRPLHWAAERDEWWEDSKRKSLARIADSFCGNAIRDLTLPQIRDRTPPQLRNYSSVVSEYTRRKLSRPSDAVNAIQGVLQTLKRIGPFFHGMPDRYLDAALLWHAAMDSNVKRRASKDAPFPSWTWAGWELPDGCSWFERDLISTGHMAGCSKWIIGGSHIHPTWSCGERAYAPSCVPDISAPAQAKLQEVGYLLYFKAAIAKFAIGKAILPDRGGQNYRTKDRVSSKKDGYRPYEIVDSLERCVGEMWISESSKSRYERRPLDFISLSWGTGLEVAQPAVIFTPRKGRSHDWDAVNVMMVEWTDGIAERVSLGKVIAQAWGFYVDRKEWIFLN